ncbi:hypothetical protein MTR_1g041825 [Medicago truncatula]|uniref:Uncharacterized protein n=1 Tax=Medicago truncatula TaxID=3880 RepID=A0A072VSK0_MEDTR|nr:hypothetical protein MTR_1g041825 [Medicago truncatula]
MIGPRCRTPLCWYESGENSMIGPKVVQQTTEKFHDRIVKLGMLDSYQPPACEGILAIHREEEDKTKREAQVT